MQRRQILKAMSMAPLAASLSGLANSAGMSQASGTEGPKKHKLVMIGAGSAMFTQGLIIDWLRGHPKADWEIALVDINPEILAATEKMVRRYMMTTDSPAKITATTDRKDVLSGATAVVCTIGVGSRRAWEQDVFVPRKHGIFQPVGDSVMPGGVSRAMRMIPPMLDIARDAERMCPNARFINYSNPLTAIVRALRKHTGVKATGLCMGTEETIHHLARIIKVPRKDVTARWIGLNHLTWILDFRANGVDMWPKVRATVAEQRKAGIDRSSWGSPFGDGGKPGLLNSPFSWELFDEFGAFPAPMDRHTTEYFPERFPHGRYYGSTLGVDAYSFEGTIAKGDEIYDRTIRLAKEDGPIPVQRTGGEHSEFMDIFDSMEHDRRRMFSVNVPQNGMISSLPKDAVLEIPGLATADGIIAPPPGELPTPIAAVLQRRLAAVEATVEAAVTGNRKLFVQALILDGGVWDYTVASKLADDLIAAQKQHLPQFA